MEKINDNKIFSASYVELAEEPEKKCKEFSKSKIAEKTYEDLKCDVDILAPDDFLKDETIIKLINADVDLQECIKDRIVCIEDKKITGGKISNIIIDILDLNDYSKEENNKDCIVIFEITEEDGYTYIFDELLNKITTKNGYKKNKRKIIYRSKPYEDENRNSNVKLRIDLTKKFIMYKTTNFEVINGMCLIKEIVDYYHIIGDILFIDNVRLSLNKNDFTKDIIKSIIETPREFPLFHNGLVINGSKVNMNTGLNEIKIEKPSIVNGAQTVVAIGRFQDALKKCDKIDKFYDFEKNGFTFEFRACTKDEKVLEIDVPIKFDLTKKNDNDENNNENIKCKKDQLNYEFIEREVKKYIQEEKGDLYYKRSYNDHLIQNALSKLNTLYICENENSSVCAKNNNMQSDENCVLKLQEPKIKDYVDYRLKNTYVTTKIFYALDDVVELDNNKYLIDKVHEVSYNSNNQIAINAKEKHINHPIVMGINKDSNYADYNIYVNKAGEKVTNLKNKKFCYSLADIFSNIEATVKNKPGKSRNAVKDRIIEEYYADKFIVENLIIYNEETGEYELKEEFFYIQILEKLTVNTIATLIKLNEYPEYSEILNNGKKHILNYTYKKINQDSELKKEIIKNNVKFDDTENKLQNLVVEACKLLYVYIKSKNYAIESNTFKKDFNYNIDVEKFDGLEKNKEDKVGDYID